jgi:hypothetical protein
MGTLARTARMACAAGVILGMAVQAEQIISHGHRKPGYEKEAAAIARELAGELERSGKLKGNLIVVSHNRYAMHALTGLPVSGYGRSYGGRRFLVREEQRRAFEHFLVVVDAHLRNGDTAPGTLRSHFGDRRVREAHIPVVLNPIYKEYGLKFTDDLFEFYLLSREDVEKIRELEARRGEDGGRRGKDG